MINIIQAFIMGSILTLLCLLVSSTALHCAESPSSTAAQTNENPISLDMYADREQASIGDEIRLTITYTWPNGFIVNPEPNPAAVLDQYHTFIVDAPPVQQLNTGTHQQRRWNFTILAQQSGAWSLPRPGFQASDAQGTVYTISAPEIILQIGIVEKPPLLSEPSSIWTSEDSGEIGLHQRYWKLYIISGFLVLAAIAALFRRKKETPQISPFEQFEQVILNAKQHQDVKESAALLSLAIRQYCAHIWSFDGIGATNFEMRGYLKRHLSSTDLSTVCGLLDKLETFRWAPHAEQNANVHGFIIDAEQWCRAQEQARQAALEEVAS